MAERKTSQRADRQATVRDIAQAHPEWFGDVTKLSLDQRRAASRARTEAMRKAGAPLTHNPHAIPDYIHGGEQRVSSGQRDVLNQEADYHGRLIDD